MIDEQSVQRMLSENRQQYIVTSSNVGMAEALEPIAAPDHAIFGTSSSAEVRMMSPEDAKIRLLSLRKRIEDSGVPLLGEEELQREIDATKGRQH